MAIATAVSLGSRRNRAASLSTPPPKPNFCVSASAVSIGTSETISPTSFLDQRESGILHFVEYQGLGNDLILVDNRNSTESRITTEQVMKLCDRNFGMGADGVIFAMPGVNRTGYTMRIFNSDGGEPEMCGNGMRCFARFIAELENLKGRHRYHRPPFSLTVMVA
ncbi:hypothetical protein SLEP1_g17734 [Rubroshorea leprosula]|uniref:diaminopimelate epimerase n=1 Tax=Rubroshorea leprosula TaxID=152421 RepID=A0AAV5J0S7_9ROSI|nr:hypothetical protein SLEP1_g17734 [Rubroshorea leprosula]